MSIFIGGTGSANELEDYEEGTFTVTTSISGVTLTNNTAARYRKIGQMVYVQMDVSVGSNSDGNTSRFSMPFSSSVSYGSGIAGWSSLGRPIMFHISGSQAFGMDNSSSGNSSQHLTMSELSGHRFIASYWYIHTG